MQRQVDEADALRTKMSGLYEHLRINRHRGAKQQQLHLDHAETLAKRSKKLHRIKSNLKLRRHRHVERARSTGRHLGSINIDTRTRKALQYRQQQEQLQLAAENARMKRAMKEERVCKSELKKAFEQVSSLSRAVFSGIQTVETNFGRSSDALPRRIRTAPSRQQQQQQQQQQLLQQQQQKQQQQRGKSIERHPFKHFALGTSSDQLLHIGSSGGDGIGEDNTITSTVTKKKKRQLRYQQKKRQNKHRRHQQRKKKVEVTLTINNVRTAGFNVRSGNGVKKEYAEKLPQV
jgi:hypothetical protein